MSVNDPTTVNRYISQHVSITAALANLTEFVDSMPAPDANDHLPNIDYGYTGSTARIYELLTEAMQIADQMTKGTR
jgi:hypothetical protein